jgi:predicted RNA-binding protein
MCLSTVYKDTKEPATMIMKNVVSIQCMEGKVQLTDLMDHQLEIPGTLDYANLVDGYVIIKSN